MSSVRLAALAALTFCIASPVTAEQTATLTDPEIAAVVVAANTVDINAGKLAKEKASDQKVKAFATRMETDHQAVNKSASALVARLKVTPKENDTSKALMADGNKTLEKLRGLEGAAFDKAYIDNEIAYHQQVLSAVDSTLIPSAKNEELKALLVKVRPAFVAHLEHAKQLQAAMAGSGAHSTH